MDIDDRPTDLLAHFGKFEMAVTLQHVIRSTLCLVLVWGFRGWRIERRHFQLDQIQKWRPEAILKNLNDRISETHYPIHFTYVHSPYFAL